MTANLSLNRTEAIDVGSELTCVLYADGSVSWDPKVPTGEVRRDIARNLTILAARTAELQSLLDAIDAVRDSQRAGMFDPGNGFGKFWGLRGGK